MSEPTSFLFHMPTDIRFGVGASEKLPELPAVAGKRCMLLCFPGFKGDDLIAALGETCSYLVRPDAFEENPSFAFVQGLARQVAGEEIDTVIAIGGGSSIDTAKAACWLAANPDWDPSSTAEQRPAKARVVALPTTAGTGSEVTPYAILTDPEGNKKILKHATIFPITAVCDPLLTVSMPKRVTAHTGIDALSHAIEAYFSKLCNGFLEDVALSACRQVAKHLLGALETPESVDARAGMMLAALSGGVVLSQCGTVMVHALGYGVTKRFGYPHGLANAVLLAGLVERLAERGAARAIAVQETFGGDIWGFIADCGIEQRLPAEGLDEATIEAWVEAGYASYGRNNSIVPLDRDDIRFILDRAIQ